MSGDLPFDGNIATMSPGEADDLASRSTDRGSSVPRLLVLVLTYNASRHIREVVRRIPRDLASAFDPFVLILDDASTDGTPEAARDALRADNLPYDWAVRVNQRNQGYGGNQKIGYCYAIDERFDVVVMVHGDAQYPPEQVVDLARLALENGAAFGSRFGEPGAARAGGMPAYKWLGNRILSAVQNRLMGTDLTEFHSGFRAYTTDALQSIPFHLNSDDFHFDTEIFIQLMRADVKIGEMSIPTRYADEECHVNGLSYAGNVVSQTAKAALHDKGIFYERKYDVGGRGGLYEAKLGFTSPAREMLDRTPFGSTVLDLGSSDGHLAGALKANGCRVVGVDLDQPRSPGNFSEFVQANLDDGLPDLRGDFDTVLLADVIEHLRSPEDFAEQLADFCLQRRVSQVIVSTGNVAFLPQRLMLLAGQFNYGPRGILDMTHTRLFTRKSITRLFEQAGFRVSSRRGIPAPFPLAIGDNAIARFLLRANDIAIKFAPTLLSYQLLLELIPPNDLAGLVAESAVSERGSAWSNAADADARV